jgi:hypothetical protein
MHTVDLGIWVHLLTCFACKIDATVRMHGVLPANKVSGVWTKLSNRAAKLDGDECMFKLNSYKANILKMLLDEKKSTTSHQKAKKKRKPQAWEHHLLMNVCFLTCVPVCPTLNKHRITHKNTRSVTGNTQQHTQSHTCH